MILLVLLVLAGGGDTRAPPVVPPPPIGQKQQQRGANVPVYAASIMIRNEAAILPRLLASLRPFVSHYIFCDTGSLDGSVEYLKKWIVANKVNGRVEIDTWETYSFNRNLCLKRANAIPGITHILFMDGDFELVPQPGSGFPAVAPPGEVNRIGYTNTSTFYRQPLLIRAGLRCGYLGVTHEYLLCVDNPNAYKLLTDQAHHYTAEREQLEASFDPSLKYTKYDGIRVLHHADGSNRWDKFDRDIRLLREDIEHYDPTNPRSWFYLARSLEDSKKYSEAFDAYHRRIELGTGPEELWYSVLRMGHCLLGNGSKIEDAARYFVDAFNYKPFRREPLYILAREYRLRGKYEACKLYALHALSIAPNQEEDPLFTDLIPYEWGVHDELSLCLYEIGDYQTALLAGKFIIDRMHQMTTLDDANRHRIITNMAFFKAKLPPDQQNPTFPSVQQPPAPTPMQQQQPAE